MGTAINDIKRLTSAEYNGLIDTFQRNASEDRKNKQNEEKYKQMRNSKNPFALTCYGCERRVTTTDTIRCYNGIHHTCVDQE